MSTNKIVYGIDILDYEEMDIKDSHRWLIETEFKPSELDKITNKLVHKKGRPSVISASSLASEMERLKYLRIIEDLTGVKNHTSELEI